MRVVRLLSRRSVAAAGAVAALAATTLPAGAATTTTPSHGRASSALTILRLTIAGETVTAGRIVAVAGNAASPHVAKLVVTPISSSLTGALGQCTVTATGTTCAGGQTISATPKTVTLPNGLGSVVGPTFVAQAKDTASSVLATARLSALGKVTLAGVPIDLRLASLSHTAEVVAGNATARKSFSLGDLSLPSVADLLSSLGLDLTKLADQLTQGKLTQLAGLVTSTTSGAVKTANDAVDSAQAAVAQAGASVPTTLDAATAQLAAATQTLTTDNTAFGTAWAAAFGALPAATQGLVATALTTAGLGNPPTADELNALGVSDAAALAAIQALFDGVDPTLWPTISSAAQAVATAETVVTTLNDLINALQSLIDAVVDAVNGDTDPIAALGGLKLTTKAVAAHTPTAAAALSVGSIDVLGQSASLSQLSAAVGTVGATLASVLNSVPGVTFTPPSISLGTPSRSTHTQGQTRFASAALRGLTVKLPTLSLSAAATPLALPGGVTSGAGSLVLGELTESAQWTPAVTTSSSPVPGASGGPQLGDTGGRVLLPILATVLLAAAAVVRRRWGHA